MSYDRRRLRANLRAARINMGLSQRELAIQSGVSHVQIAYIETSKHSPTVTTLAKLAGAAGVTVAELVEGVDT